MITFVIIVGIISWYAAQIFEYGMWCIGHWLWEKGIRF